MLLLGKLFWTNVFFFCLYLLLGFLSPSRGASFFFDILFSSLILILVFPLLGANLTSITERLCKENFNPLERLSLSALFALIFSPLLLSIESEILGGVSPHFPLFNTLGVFLIAIFLSRSSSMGNPTVLSPTFKLPPSFFWTTGMYALFVWVLLHTYSHLPDSDPYYWISKLQGEMNSGILTSLTLHRPLFSALAYLFHTTAGIDLYAFFKYVLPFLTLLIFLPGALVARLFPSTLHQTLVLLLPFSSASFILYSELPIPQAIINICIVFFTYFLLYAWLAKRNFFYFVAGAMILFAYFHHEMAVILFVFWAIATLFYFHRPLWKHLQQHKLAVFLVLIILGVYNYPLLQNIFSFFTNWFKVIFPVMLRFDTNLTFPLSYVNIDGNTMGWNNLPGVIKYYLFYVGPAVVAVLLAFAFFLNQSVLRQVLRQELKKRKEFFLLILLFLLFFTLAEILPRFFSIALLPERSWGFAGFFLLALLPALLFFSPNKHPVLSLLVLGGIVLNLGAAFYINSLKQYLITPAQIASTDWIKANLPKDRVMITTESLWGIIKIHAQSDFLLIKNPAFYSNEEVFDKNVGEALSGRKLLATSFNRYIIETDRSLKELRTMSPLLTPEMVLKNTKEIQENTSELERITNNFQTKEAYRQKPLYIYFAKDSPHNPYANRPYYKQDVELTSFFFDTYPQTFRRVYTAPNDAVVIWKLIQK